MEYVTKTQVVFSSLSSSHLVFQFNQALDCIVSSHPCLVNDILLVLLERGFDGVKDGEGVLRELQGVHKSNWVDFDSIFVIFWQIRLFRIQLLIW